MSKTIIPESACGGAWALVAVLGDAIEVLKRDQAAGQLPRSLAIVPASVRNNPFA